MLDEILNDSRCEKSIAHVCYVNKNDKNTMSLNLKSVGLDTYIMSFHRTEDAVPKYDTSYVKNNHQNYEKVIYLNCKPADVANFFNDDGKSINWEKLEKCVEKQIIENKYTNNISKFILVLFITILIYFTLL